MAGHLLRAGHEVVVWNRTPAKADRWVAEGAERADSLTRLAVVCGFVFLCVGRTEDVEDCLAAMTPAARPGTLFVDHSTISAAGARSIHARLAEQGLRFLDAPITGGSMGAEKGTLTIFVGGEEADFQEALPVMQAYGRRIERVGPAGAGQTLKAANQIAVGGALLGLCESLALVKRAGLDVAQARELLASGAAGSWAFENYGPKILNEDWSPGFSVANQHKDFGYCRELAAELGLPDPLTETAMQVMQDLLDRGEGELTTAAAYRLYLEDGSP